MTLTDIKIKVTDTMMESEEMIMLDQIAIPENPKNPEESNFTWKSILSGEITDEDFDKIEEYFLNK